MKENNLVDLAYDFTPKQYIRFIDKQKLTGKESEYVATIFSTYLEKTITDNNFYEQLSLFKELVHLTCHKDRVIISLLDTLTVCSQNKQVNHFLQEFILSHIQNYAITETILDKIRKIKQLLCKELFLYLSYYTLEFKDQLLSNNALDTESESNELILYGVGLFGVLNEHSYLPTTLENLKGLVSNTYDIIIDVEGMLTTKREYKIFKYNLKRMYQINPKTKLCVDEMEYGEGDEDEFPMILMFLILGLMKTLLLLKLLNLGDTFEIASKKELSSYLFITKLFMFMSKSRKPLFKKKV